MGGADGDRLSESKGCNMYQDLVLEKYQAAEPLAAILESVFPMRRKDQVPDQRV